MRKSFCRCAAVCVVVLMFSAAGCSRRSRGGIQFDDSEPLALAPDVTWAVIQDPYAGYRQDPSWDAKVSGSCRKGDILQVLGQNDMKDSGTWYEFSKGWLPASVLSVYSNRFRAESAARILSKQ